MQPMTCLNLNRLQKFDGWTLKNAKFVVLKLSRNATNDMSELKQTAKV